jgi:gliding motility-associated-like protein
VNLSANPDTVWTYTGTRLGSCCGISGGQECIRFNVTVHPQATQIGFNVANPAPPGGAFYQVNCGAQTSLGTPLCITGLSTFCISFCKNGGDSPNYTIASSRTFTTTPDITLSQGCIGQIGVTGMQTSTVQWTSIAPGSVGQYNSYLSCTSACTTPTVTPGSNPPAYVDYRVSGMVVGCSSGTVADTVRVNFVSGVGGTTSPTAPAVCFGSATTLVTATGSGGLPPYTYEWKDSGGVTIGTSASQALGVGNFTVTVRDQLPNCPGTTLPVTVIAHPSGITANAGADQLRCNSSPAATLSGSVNVATGGTWTASGTGGTFSPNASTLNATFTPSASQLSSGSVTLALTTTGNGGCTAATDQMVITYAATPVVSAGSNQTICSNGTAQLNGSVNGGASQGQWSSNGTGTFSPSATAMNAVYTPSAADITAGSRTLTLTSTNGCTPISSSMTLTIQPPPVVSAGANASVCASSPAHQLNGSVTGGTTTGIWSTSGSGSFTPNASTLNATYNPSAADISAGTVTLTLTSTGGCATITSQKTLQIRPITSVSAGANTTICEGSTLQLNGTVSGSTTTGTWSTTGNGTFSPSATALNAVYTPGSTEISSGTATITLTSTGAVSCPNTSSSFTLTITPAPVVNAGTPQTICAGSTAQLNGSITAGGSTGTWSGPGAFSPNANALNAVFTPNAAAVSAGTATLTLTSTNGCVVRTAQTTITIQPQPVVNAGADITICEGSISNLSGSVTVGGSTGSWSTSGSGSFSPSASTLNATYTPSATDISAGSVTLTLTSTDGCAVNNDVLLLTITPAPIVNAGADQLICQESTAALSGSVSAGGSAGTWSTSGTGSFSSATDLNAEYTPGPEDISSGTVTLTLTSTNGCVVRTDQLVLTIAPLPLVNAGANAQVCASNPVYTLNGSVTVGGSTGIWSSSGSGSLSPNANALNATYTASAADISAGSVTLTLTATNGCSPVSDPMTLQIRAVPVVNVGSDRTICEGQTVALTGTVTGSTTTGVWSSSGTGTFSPSANSLNATYTPSAADIAAGMRTITLTSTNSTPCSPVSNSFQLTITPAPVVNAGAAQTICYGSTATLNGSVTAGGSTGVWSGPGSFSPNANALNAVFTPNTTAMNAGTATLTLTSTDGCVVRTAQTTITITPLPVVNAGTDVTVCTGSNASLNGSITSGGSAGTWSSSGSGSFSPSATALNATYTPSNADITAGSVILTLTSTNGCSNLSDDLTLTITPAPSVNAGSDQTICQGTAVSLAGTITAGGTTGTWSSSGSGSFAPSASALNATYTPSSGDISAGTITLTLTSTNGCTVRNDAMQLTITPLPVVNAGSNSTICAVTPTHALNGSITVGGSAGIWSTSGTGSFSPNATALNATYNASASDISAGSVVLTLTSTDGCATVNSSKTLTIQPQSIANAGNDVVRCVNNSSVVLAGSVTGFSSTGIWSTAGTGSFSSNTALNATYSPSASDRANGSVQLTLTTTGNGVCPSTSDQMTVTFTPAPVVNAGVNQTICANNAVATLNGSVSAGATTGTWTTSGTGTFSSATALNTTYTASAADIGSGSVILTLTSTNHGNCVAVNDQMTISFSAAPVVNAGPDVSVCINNPSTPVSGTVTGGASTGTWTTAGDGSFNNANSLSTTYNPGPNDLSAGSVMVTLSSTNFGNCIAVSDSRVISFGNGPVVSAGADQTMCANNTVQLAGSVTGSTSTGAWSTSGSGTFSPSNTALNAIYQPSAADTTAGSVILTLVSTNNGTCNIESDQMTVTFTPAPVVNAGVNQTVCANNAVATLAGSVSAGATTGTWTTNGTGTFSSATALNATYMASASDISGGSVIHTLTSTNHGNCLAVNDQMTISFSAAPVVNAGTDVSVCINNPATPVSGTVTGGASTGTWTTAGDGSFTNANSLSTTYNPGPNDLSAGSVMVTLTSTNFGNCIAGSDSRVISFGNGPVVSAGIDQTMCANNTVQLAGSVTGSTSTGAWSTSGSGTFSPSNTALDAMYQPSAADTTAGSVVLTLVSTNNGTCNIESDQMTVTFTPAPVVNAGINQTICANNAVATLNGSVTAGATTGTWSSSGTGTFSSATALNATYTASASDISGGSVILTLTSTNHGNCIAVTDQMTISFSPAAVVNAGPDVNFCINNPSTPVSGTVTGGASTGTWTTAGDGSFTNANNLNTTYNPGPNDLSAGSVTVTLTSTNFGNCIAVSDSLVISFGNGPVVNAGIDQTMCANNTVQLAGSVTGSTSTGAWSTSGSGTFSPSNTTLNATYQPSAADTTAGSVILTLVSTNNGTCNVESDQMTVTFTPAPVVNAGINQTICANNAVAALNGSVTAGASTGTWTTSGTGTFSSATALNATYTASAADISGGSVILTLTSTNHGNCVAVNDQMAISFSASPVVNAGPDVSVCINNPATPVSGTVTGGASTGTWTTAGDGSFNNANNLNTIYNPGPNDLASGSVVVTLTSTNFGNCIAVSDSRVISFGNGPVVSAGADQTMCANNTVQLAGSVTGSTSTGAWSTSGSGTFSPSNTALNAIYQPSAADTTAGSVILTLVSTNNGTCNIENDQITITFTPAPVVNAGVDQTICANNAVATLNGSVTAGASTGSWSTSGTGTFGSTTDLNTTYTPSAEDLNGSVVITLTSTNHGNCAAVNDQMTITYIEEPQVLVGADQFVCIGDNVQLDATIINGSGTGIWTTSGNGSFNNANALSTTYIPSQTDLDNGVVVLTLTSTNNGNCAAEADELQVNFTLPPNVTVGADQTVCDNAQVQLNGSVSGSTTTGLWSTSGDGQFIPSVTAINATYEPGPTDASMGTVTITLEATNACAMQDQLVLTVSAGPVVNAGPDRFICTGTDAVQMEGTVGGTATLGQWTTMGDGTFSPSTDALDAIYNLGPNDLSSSTIAVLLTSVDNGVCSASTDTMFISVNGVPVLEAGVDTVMCVNQELVLNGSTSDNSPVLWTSSGTGTFSPSAEVLDAEYHFSEEDAAAGTIIITLNAPQACVPTASHFDVAVIPAPIVDPGMDQTVCAGVPVTVSGAVTSDSGTGTWSTLGTGTFITDPDQLTATYQPSADDIAAGSVNLMLTSTGDTYCAPMSSIVTIEISGGFSATAGNDQLVCDAAEVQLNATISGDATLAWSSIGAGGFSPSPDMADATYTATADELPAGITTIILTATDNNGCGTMTDSLTVTFSTTPSVDAGVDLSICSGVTSIQLNGAVSGTATTGAWSTNGDGQFMPDASTLNAIYELGANDQLNGVELTLISTNNGVCGAGSNSMTITIANGISVDAGADVTACDNTPGITLSGIVEGATTTGVWTTAGDGTFNDDAVEINAVYQPGAEDIANGSVWLYLTSTNNGDCTGVMDSLQVTFQQLPEVVAGDDVIACASGTIELTGTVPAGASVTWVTDGGGVINDPSSPNTTYEPVASDGGNDVTFQLLVSNGCGIVADTLIATILETPQIDVQAAVECGSTEVTFTNNSVGAMEMLWQFGDNSSSTDLSPLHDYAAPGSYDVSITATNGDCTSSGSITIVVPESVIASFTATPGTVELYEYVDLQSTSIGATSWEWDMGDGTTDVSGEAVQHVYNAAGEYTITLYASNGSGCIDSTSVLITVFEVPGIDPPTVLPVGIPTAFTPNGDNQNDIFLVRGGPFEQFDLRVYDNWGVQLFSSNEQTIGWNGTYNGKDQPSAVYVYTFSGRTIDGQQVDMAGDISIIR